MSPLGECFPPYSTVHGGHEKGGTPYTAFSPQDPLLVLAETARIAMTSEECEDVTMLTFLLYCGHGMGKRTPSGGGHYSLVKIVRGDTIHSDNVK